ncbi:hypothetical protein [Gloeobacter morelensis]|uniref:hypothetical protein n=1 Tax=Gloeobacter morelensis TaxID=2907343 RepID=UPI001E28B693|nr:hypothetical protein [Gloeobacter morelensis]UFP97161.1 hypothetical protein ISF26_23865 [Gloeobacter morelensis MG652769]
MRLNPKSQTAICYLLHFAQPYHHALHYLGSAVDLEARLARHAAGNGSRLLAAVAAAGIPWQVARTWQGGRDLEAQLKKRKSNPSLCPICSARGTASAPAQRRRGNPPPRHPANHPFAEKNYES